MKTPTKCKASWFARYCIGIYYIQKHSEYAMSAVIARAGPNGNVVTLQYKTRQSLKRSHNEWCFNEMKHNRINSSFQLWRH